MISDAAQESGNQIIAASHSEVLLTEAADRDMVIAFVGKPHRMDDRGSQVLKSLRDIGFDQYYQAEQTGWVLYLEGSTDLAIMKTFARRLGHERALKALERPFVSYVENQPSRARNHYFGLREAIPELKGLALFDRLEMTTDGGGALEIHTWQRREIENYFCTRSMLEAYAQASAEADSQGPLFAVGEKPRRIQAMSDSITEIEGAMFTLGQGSPWDAEVKVSDIFLTPLFRNYFKKLDLPNLMNKKDFYELANYIPAQEISPEISGNTHIGDSGITRPAEPNPFPDGDDPVATTNAATAPVEIGKPAKTKHRSAEITHDPQRAPARAMLMAMGITHEDMEKPFVAIANLASDVTPCNAPGPVSANGAKRVDGISMGTEGMKASLVSREVIADSIELVTFGERDGRPDHHRRMR
ncbi:Dihydroxy-acid dehydratase [Geodia barretti]|uniref:Dihydroxy-acid dehydratase n=1 Tax=Geodia barretti TaxID=519541 RepID=A0AA35TLN8_GEOBA|nr:Dihydroxy-acid dehydratase [Geodia barretti]